MKVLPISILLLVTGLSVATLPAQESSSTRLAVLPLHSNGVDSVWIVTSESNLRTEIGKLSPMEIVSVKRTREALENTPCSESECAVEIGKKLDATQVLG